MARGLHENIVDQTIAIVIIMPVLALITVILRLYTRIIIIKNPCAEDLCIAIAMIFSIGVTVTIICEVHYGLGRPLASVDPTLIPGYLKSLFASILLYNLGLTFTKLSILLQYAHIAVISRVRKAIWALLVFVIVYWVETLFAGIFQCTPVAFFWDESIAGGKCIDKFALYFAHAGVNIITDFMILLFPILILKDLIMPRTQKIILIGIIALGGAACLASIFRLHLLYEFSISKDITWDGTGAATWSSVEINVGIICGSVSTLRPLFSRFLPKMFRSRDAPTTITNTPPTFSSSNYTANVEAGRFNFLDDESELAVFNNENVGTRESKLRGEV